MSEPIAHYIDRASFSIWSKEEIKGISVKKVTEPKSFEKGGALNQDGLYSRAMGACKKFEICTTCGLNDSSCPGHYGHIELSVPVYHPLLVREMYQLISKCCLECFHFRLSQPALKLFKAQLEALNNGFDFLVDELDEIAKDICKGVKADKDAKYISIVLENKLMDRIQEEKDKDQNFDCQKRPQQRSIVERVAKLFRSFINGHLIKAAKLCPNCGEKKTSMTLHQQSVIVMGLNSSKPIDDDDGVDDEPVLHATKKRQKKSTKTVSELKKGGYLHYLKTDERQFLTPIGARHFLRQHWEQERRVLRGIFPFLNKDTDKSEESSTVKDEANDTMEKSEEKLEEDIQFHPIDSFFIDTILVPPCKYRPPMMQRGFSFEGPRTAALSNVLKLSITVQDLLDKLIKEKDEIEFEKLQPKLQSSWKNLQIAVNCLYDNEMDKYNKNKYPGLKQLIDKKEGLFRKNMMGKRVNFAARSVISPDPNISVDQIGVPLVFAMKLSYPEPVTPWNIEKMREAIRNGPNKYPGAMSVVFEDNTKIPLLKESTRESIASRISYNPRVNRFQTNQNTHKCTIVNRHLITDDVLLFNRQPTLHKPSIMAFRARVLPNEKGFRLHYANCKSFNADFDGDEMNAHLPQSELARSEAFNIASVNHQYLVPKDGSPLGGLIQDHVVAVCILTRRDQFFDREKYQGLVYCAIGFLDKKIVIERPAILSPEALWTGKQVITTVIKNCIPPGKLPPTLNIKSKISPKILNIPREFEDLCDCNVIIRNGELLVGFMDKSNVGATQYGLIHTCYELYGGETSSNLMSAFARLSTWYLQLYEGFTLGIGDILVEDDANEDRRIMIEDSLLVGHESAKDALGVSGDVSEDFLEDKLRGAHSDRNPLPMKKLDASMKTRTDKITSEISSRCLPEGLINRFPKNNLQMMIQSGAKGGTVNALQISCLLGQIELEGRRVPLSMSGRSLPSFKPYDTSPKAGGFVSGRFLTGIQPQEFFFHCMAGREGLIDTAVKTSRSGYLQRCLIKHLEGLTVQYDQTVRDSCGSVIQFLYGEDGLDIVKSQMLKEKAFKLLVENYKIIKPSDEEQMILNKAKENYESEVISRAVEIQEWLDKNGDDRVRKIRGSGFLDFLANMINEEREKLSREKEQEEPNIAQQERVRTMKDENEREIAEQGELKITEHEELNIIANINANADMAVRKLAEMGEEIQEKSGKSSQLHQTQTQLLPNRIGSQHHDKIFDSWYALSFKDKKKWSKKRDLCPDPLIALMNPASHFGVVPERLDQCIETFVRKNPQLVVNSASLIVGGDNDIVEDNSQINTTTDSVAMYDIDPELSKSILTHWNESIVNRIKKPHLTKHEFFNLCYNLYMKMLAQPGEAVGLLAAQSIGEPSTQMTLNTFHFAGRGDMNVTLGIPRLREILMTASAKIGTPSMDLPLLKVMRDEFGDELDEDEVEEQATKVRLALNAVRLSDVLEYVDITERVLDGGYLETTASSKTTKQEAKTKKKNPRKRRRPGSSNDDDVRRKKGTKDTWIQYEVTFALLGSKYYKHEFKCNSKKAMKFIEESFINHLVNSMSKRQKKLHKADILFDLSTKQRVIRERVSKTGGKDSGNDDGDAEEENLDAFNTKAIERTKEDDSSSEEDEDEDGDNTTQRIRNRQNPDLDYDEPEDDDYEVGETEVGAVNEEEGDKDIIVEDEEEDLVNQVFEEVDEPLEEMDGTNGELLEEFEEPLRKKSKASNLDQETISKRIDKVRCIDLVTDYEFDTKHERWCKVTFRVELTPTRLDMADLIETEARRTFVYRVGQIQRAFIVKDVDAKLRGAKCDKMIKTEGVSLLSLVNYKHILDLNAIYSNDIHAIANTYGIEAASQAIRREMANVFAVYGIEVDPRHLSLIADYMTYSGSIRGMNRMSMEASASPFQQMSYESTIRYLKWAAVLGLYDDIKSPSASLVFGRPTKGGTGLFGLRSSNASTTAAAHR